MSSSVSPLDIASDQTTDDKLVSKSPEKSHHKGEFVSWRSSLLIAA